MRKICPCCNKEFELTLRQEKLLERNPNFNMYCSRSCKSKYTGIKYYKNHREHCQEVHQEYYKNYKEQINQKYKEYRKEYKKRNKEYISQRDKKYYKKNKEHINQMSAEYYKKNKEYLDIHQSIQHYNKDFSPNQNDKYNLTLPEKLKFIRERSGAVPKARKSHFGERTSKRKGVCKITRKSGRICYTGYLLINGVSNRKYFDTEEEAIAYRIYLEDTYYTPEQLAIRDKYTD